MKHHLGTLASLAIALVVGILILGGREARGQASADAARAVVSALFAGDASQISNLLRFTTTACTHNPVGPGAPPQCRSDEAEGTQVEVFPVGFACEGGYTRRVDVQDTVSLLSNPGRKVLGVFSYQPIDSSPNPFFYGDFVIVATVGQAPTPANAGGIWIGNGGITGVHVGGCFGTPDQFEATYHLQNRVDLTQSLPPTGMGDSHATGGLRSPYVAFAVLGLTLMGAGFTVALRRS